MKPQNWGALSILMMAFAVALGTALAGTVGVILDPVLTRVERQVAAMMQGGGTQNA